MKKKTQKFKSFASKQNTFTLATFMLYVAIILFCIKGNAQTLIFKNGFEGTTRIEQRTVTHEKIKGSDNSNDPSDWETDLVNNPYFGYGEIVYEQGDATQRKAEIVVDPANANNKALRFRIRDQHILMSSGERKARIQYDLQNKNAAPPGGYIKQYYQKNRIYFSPDFKILEDSPTDFGWFIMQEFWNDPQFNVPGGQQRKETRVDFEVTRLRHVAGEKLRFGAKFRDPVNIYPATWEYVNPNFEIPLGKWITQEIYIKEGDDRTGRIYMAVTVDGQKTVIVDRIGRTVGVATNSYTPDGQTSWNPMKIYMEGKVARLFKDKGKILDVYWDDLEIWFDRTPESSIGLTAPSRFITSNVQATQATLNWVDNSNNETQFVLERRNVTAGEDYSLVQNLPANTTTFTDFNLLAGNTYNYRLSAKNSNNQSSYVYLSNSLVTPNVPILPPSSFTASNIQTTQATLQWIDNATNETQYVIERRSITDDEDYTLVQVLAANVTSFVDTALLPSKNYRYRLVAKNNVTQSTYVYLDVTTPSIVVASSGLNVTAIQETQATLRWIDNSNNETAFVIDRRSVTDGGDYTYLSTVNANTTSFTDATLMPNKEYRYRLSAKNGNVVSGFSYSAVFKTIELNGTGLQATYYNNMDFTGTSITRIDPTINFNWGNGSPSTSIQADTFSASWIGQVKPKTTGTYTFYTNSDDGVRLWVNGILLINKWNNQATTEYSGTIQLNGGQKYDIALEYFDNTRGAVVQLSWSSIGLPKEIIPQSALYPSTGVANKVVNTVNSTTIVKEISESNPSFLVYPNPAKDILYFDLETINESSIVAELVSSENKVVKTVSYTASKDKPTYSLDITGIPAGIYYLKINNGLQIVIKKIIID